MAFPIRQRMLRAKLSMLRKSGPFARDEPGNIATPNGSFPGENSANQPKILPVVLAGIVSWRGFPRDDRTVCPPPTAWRQSHRTARPRRRHPLRTARAAAPQRWRSVPYCQARPRPRRSDPANVAAVAAQVCQTGASPQYYDEQGLRPVFPPVSPVSPVSPVAVRAK